jgi:hypothetical protein
MLCHGGFSAPLRLPYNLGISSSQQVTGWDHWRVYPTGRVSVQVIQVRRCGSITGIYTGNSKFSPPKATQDFFYDVESPPLPASSGESQAETSYTDGSGALFSMYLNRAEEEDKRAAERWKGDADGILVFVRCWRNLLFYIPRDHILIIPYHRLVCSRLPLQPSLWGPTKACSQAHRTSTRSISPLSPKS